MKRLTIFTLLFLGIYTLNAQDYIRAKGKYIVNSKGEEIILRGMGLGGWMLQEGYMLQLRKNGTQHAIKSGIEALIGKEETEKFYDEWLKNHVTKAEVDSMASWGFNSIRLPMHYNLFTPPIENEPAPNKITWLPRGFQMVDSLISWCKANNMYLILDLHAAPGGQGNDANISDYDTSKPALWRSEWNQQKTIALWKQLAERYSNNPTIGGYDLINEPNWPFDGNNKNGCRDTANAPLWKLYKEITKAIREVDTVHMIIIEGNCWGNNYKGFPGVWDNNMVFSFHKYWNENTQKAIDSIVSMREKYNIPIWLGESGENSNQWFHDCISLIEKNKIGWAWWPLKKIGTPVCPLTAIRPQGYDEFLAYWNEGKQKPSPEKAKKMFSELTENLKIKNCEYHPDYIDAMFRQIKDTTTKPFKNIQIPGYIFASDFDMGQQGYAYWDTEYDNIGKPGRKGGNLGRAYRNDGADVSRCHDSLSVTNGFNLSHIEDNEWVVYTFDAKENGEYNLSLRYSTDSIAGMVKVEIDNIVVASNIKPSATGKKIWATLNIGKADIKKGKHKLKVMFEKGIGNLSYIKFEKSK